MNYPKDIPHRYTDNGEIVSPEYRILAGQVDGALLFASIPMIGEPEFENDHSMYMKFKDEESYKKALGLLDGRSLGHIMAIYGMRSKKTVFIQMTGA